MKFHTSDDLVLWYKKVQQVASKELKVKKYIKRVKQQEDRLQQENVKFLYKTTLGNIDVKLSELKKLMYQKLKIEI